MLDGGESEGGDGEAEKGRRSIYGPEEKGRREKGPSRNGTVISILRIDA